MEVEDTLEFVITIKRNGKLCHSFHSNDYVYRRKEVKASGVAYFVCTVDKCPMRLQRCSQYFLLPQYEAHNIIIELQYEAKI